MHTGGGFELLNVEGCAILIGVQTVLNLFVTLA